MHLRKHLAQLRTQAGVLGQQLFLPRLRLLDLTLQRPTVQRAADSMPPRTHYATSNRATCNRQPHLLGLLCRPEAVGLGFRSRLLSAVRRILLVHQRCNRCAT
jgi:hypothetical protein